MPPSYPARPPPATILPMTTLRIANGRVIDPSQRLDTAADVWVQNGRVVDVGPHPHLRPDRTIDAAGCVVCPGLIDMHVHLREPRREEDATMRRALEYSRLIDKAVLSRGEGVDLTRGGAMHEGQVSMTLGLRGMPAVAEEVHVFRDLELAAIPGGKLHILHVSTAGSVDLIRRAKARGVRVTAEACPHHFTLTDECLRSFDSNCKMAPPLRTQKDVDAIIEGLKNGTLDVIATDHAPHAPEKKAREFDQCPNGIIGLETLIPLCVTRLIEPSVLTWPQLIAKLTVNPAQVLGVDRGTLKPGAVADVTVIDPTAEWVIDPAKFHSKSRNTPFAGWTVRGRARAVVVGGEVKREC